MFPNNQEGTKEKYIATVRLPEMKHTNKGINHKSLDRKQQNLYKLHTKAGRKFECCTSLGFTK
jgi:hypothetical protein